MTKVLQRFNMYNPKHVRSTLSINCKPNSSQCLKNEKDKTAMRRVSYGSVVGSIEYATVCTRPDIAFVVGTISRYMSNLGKGALGSCEMDTHIPERHFECMP